jgi:hypothetical protein
VQDFGTPRRSSTGLLLVNVTRNLLAPSFLPTQYADTILETQTLGASILQVTSNDGDATVSDQINSSLHFHLKSEKTWNKNVF